MICLSRYTDFSWLDIKALMINHIQDFPFGYDYSLMPLVSGSAKPQLNLGHWMMFTFHIFVSMQLFIHADIHT